MSNFDSDARRARWGDLESRVEIGVQRILERLARRGAHATFFVLGWIAARAPALVREIAAAGHEIASHGFDHRLLTELDPEAFREDVRRAKRVLEDVSGCAVLGYRAPSFTIVEGTRWALAVLVEEGHVYDSSIVPIRHDRYGIPGAPSRPHEIETSAGSLREIPPSTISVAGVRVAVCGGGYLRQLPFPGFRWALRRIQRAGEPIVLFLHPWELDPDQPRMKGSLISSFRHYRNLGRTAARLDRLLDEFAFTSIDRADRRVADARGTSSRASVS